MKILALQLKRIGDVVLTTPALAAMKAWQGDVHLVLAVHSSTAGLLPVIPHLDGAIVFGAERGWAPWQQVLTGHFDAVLDFAGSDRSALATLLSRAPDRATFDWVRAKGLRRLAFTRFVNSPVRERHTIDHYLDLAEMLTSTTGDSPNPALAAPASQDKSTKRGKYVVIHPFTARPEKNWSPQAWSEVTARCNEMGFACVLTGGGSQAEREHHAKIVEKAGDKSGIESLGGMTNLLELCNVIARADLVISCDTVAVHLAAAYARPQIALFGPTNPFHWRPRHDRAIVISAAQPEAPMTTFQPRSKGAPMDRISTATVCRAIDALLAS